MSKERYNQIIDEAYKDYRKSIHRMLESWDAKYYITLNTEADGCRPYTQETFINRIKTDQEFSERWGLKIEERELSWEERVQWVMKNTDVEWENLYIVEEVNKESSPTKLITLQYKEEKIEIYES